VEVGESGCVVAVFFEKVKVIWMFLNFCDFLANRKPIF